jgi:hypothetical protein
MDTTKVAHLPTTTAPADAAPAEPGAARPARLSRLALRAEDASRDLRALGFLVAGWGTWLQHSMPTSDDHDAVAGLVARVLWEIAEDLEPPSAEALAAEGPGVPA